MSWVQFLIRVTWKFLCTHVTSGSFLTPSAAAPFETFSGDVVPGESLAELDSFSRISTISFSKKFKNSWASYRVEQKSYVTSGRFTLLSHQKIQREENVHPYNELDQKERIFVKNHVPCNKSKAGHNNSQGPELALLNHIPSIPNNKLFWLF